MRQFVYVIAIVTSLMAAPVVAAETRRPAIAPANSLPKVLATDAWELSTQGAKGSQTPEDGGVRLDVTALSGAPARSDAQWFYEDTSAKAGKYTLRFSARASSARQMSLLGMDSLAATAPFLGPVAIELKESWQTYQCTLTLPRDLGVRSRFPCFQFGDQAGAIWIREITLVGEKQSQNLIPDMEKPATWAFNTHDRATGAMTSENGTLRIDVTGVTPEAWHVQICRTGPNLPAGKSYALRFSARSSVPTRIETVGKQKKAPYTVLAELTSFNLTTEWKEYVWRFTLTRPCDASANMPMFFLGAKTGVIWFRDMSLVQE